MKIPLSSLKKYLSTKLSPKEIAESLTLIGIEVEDIQNTSLIFEGVVVGEVIETKSHPSADRLAIARISDGSQIYQVVCGASNCRVGLKTPFAKIGARIGSLKIEKIHLRGIESEGMLCSQEELGFTKGTPEEIMELDKNLDAGTDLTTLFGDPVFEIVLTPNLGHCTSVRGVARELAAFTQEMLNILKIHPIKKMIKPIQGEVSVQIDQKDACPRYACRLIHNVSVTSSPNWLKERLQACGIQSTNAVVDIINLLMVELGQPLQSFDFDTFEDKHLVIRKSRKGESLRGLNGKEYFPSEEMVMVYAGQTPIAIGGIIGTEETKVTEKTRTILLESAYFEPSQICQTRKSLGIHTEASYRFERGTDPNGVLEALEQATGWICELAGGIALDSFIDIKTKDFEPNLINCRLSRTNRILGTKLSMSEIETIFRRLNLGIKMIGEDEVHVIIPTYRHDLCQEIDLIEEIARLYGIENIRKQEPVRFRRGSLPHSPAYLFEKEVRNRLIGEGLQELLSCDLIGPKEADLIQSDSFPSRSLIELLNPRSIHQSILRPSLLSSLLNIVKVNSNHSIHSVAGFEIGRIHFKTKEHYFEPTVVSLILTGEKEEKTWKNKSHKVDFYDLKGIVENLLIGLNIHSILFQPTGYQNFHPGRQARISAKKIDIGIMGEIHPKILKEIDLNQPVYFAELNLEDLYAIREPNTKMTPLPNYPTSTRDWTITLPKEMLLGSVVDKIKNIPSKYLESVFLLDVYHSKALGSDRKNVTLRFIYRDSNKTLSLKVVENEHERIIKQLTESKELL
ncbi:MAG: phenylalanine--tRNA ligase subunit beta [Chlamydiales bacterium]